VKTYHESYHIAGIAVGNGFTDPINMMQYSDFLYQIGLVDTNSYNEFKGIELVIETAILDGRFADALLVYTTIHNSYYVLSAFRPPMPVRVLSLQNR
jgi:hypothetical protein